MNLPVCLIDLFGYGQGSCIQIQVGPLQGQQLSPAQAGGQVQQEQFKVAVRLGLDEKPLELLAGQHLHLPAPLGRDLTAHRRVGPDQVLLHRLVQGRPAFGVSHPHHAVGEPLSMLFCANQPSPFFQVGVELLEVLLGQLPQRDLAQIRADVMVDDVLVVCLGVGTEAGFDVGLVPEVHPLAERHIGADLLRLGTAHLFH